VETSALVFARRGYEAATFSELISESGLTKGAFYFHFSSKLELALATMRHKQQQLIEAMTDALPDTARGVDRLVAMLRARARALEHDESLWCVLRLGAELGGVSGPESDYSQLNEWPIELFDELLRQGQQAASVRSDVDPRAAAETIFAAIVGMDTLALQLTGGADLAARTEHLVDLLTAGLTPRPSPTPKQRTTR
jgi:AcrR family transcriptional regulator